MPGAQSRWDGIRYQLLTALCGTAIQAERDGSDFAVFVVHEFHTSLTTVKKTDLNAKDYDAFLNAIDVPPRQRSTGMLYGPAKVAGVDCYLGKAIIDMKENDQGIETP